MSGYFSAKNIIVKVDLPDLWRTIESETIRSLELGNPEDFRIHIIKLLEDQDHSQRAYYLWFSYPEADSAGPHTRTLIVSGSSVSGLSDVKSLEAEFDKGSLFPGMQHVLMNWEPMGVIT